jgi:hypothetical protein
MIVFIFQIGNIILANKILLQSFIEIDHFLRLFRTSGNVDEALQADKSPTILRAPKVVLKYIRGDGVINASLRGVLGPDENGRSIEKGSCVIEGVSMDQHVIHVCKVLDVDHTLHCRVLEESILNNLDRPDILSDDN